jgi:hypothetical protein
MEFISVKHLILKVKKWSDDEFIQNKSTFLQSHHTLSKMGKLLSKINPLFSKMSKK